jgi:hypothetical protein
MAGSATSEHREDSIVASSSAATLGSYPVRNPVAGGNGWGTSASKAMHCCVFCWWKRRKPQPGVTRTGGKDTGIWRCVGKRALPRWPWIASWPCGCTGCGGTAVYIHSRSEFGSHAGQLGTGHGVK